MVVSMDLVTDRCLYLDKVIIVDDSNSDESIFKSKLYKFYPTQEKYRHLYQAVVNWKDINCYFFRP